MPRTLSRLTPRSFPCPAIGVTRRAVGAQRESVSAAVRLPRASRARRRAFMVIMVFLIVIVVMAGIATTVAIASIDVGLAAASHDTPGLGMLLLPSS